MIRIGSTQDHTVRCKAQQGTRLEVAEDQDALILHFFEFVKWAQTGGDLARFVFADINFFAKEFIRFWVFPRLENLADANVKRRNVVFITTLLLGSWCFVFLFGSLFCGFFSSFVRRGLFLFVRQFAAAGLLLLWRLFGILFRSSFLICFALISSSSICSTIITTSTGAYNSESSSSRVMKYGQHILHLKFDDRGQQGGVKNILYAFRSIVYAALRRIIPSLHGPSTGLQYLVQIDGNIIHAEVHRPIR
mmetsp:Transcript_9429/g.14008  ORF Transcript_9429/g.14008 Transcript_9429/m.14008 type:complete len:249 (-) Transcript_9429:483-1229(-)